MASSFYKYADNPTVYNQQNQALDYNTYIAQGGATNFSNVQTIGGSAPNLLQSTPAPAPAPAPKPAPTVMTSQPARTATYQNVNQLSQAESLLGQPSNVSPTAIQSVYSKRSDLQELYNPDGTAKNAADPRVAEIPTLQDWASKYGVKEEALLQGGGLNVGNTGNPAANRIVDTINDKLKAIKESGGTLTPEEQALFDQVQGLSGKELPLLSAARTAVDNDSYKEFNAYMKQVEQLRTERNGMIGKLLENLNVSDAERQAGDRLRTMTQAGREEQLDIETQPIVREIANRQGVSAAKRQALQEMAAAENLSALTNQRKVVVDTLTTALQFNQQDIEMTLGIANEMRQIAKEQKDEAKQALTDMLAFSEGRSFSELDPQSQQAIVTATANSPFTLGMVENALGAANRTFAQENGVTEPFYFAADGRTVINTKTGRAYTNEQEFFADGGAKDFSNVATVTAKPATADISEFEYAKKQGYTGTYQQWVDRDSKYKTTGGGGGGGGPTKAETKAATAVEAENDADSFLSQSAGSDGYVSPEDWKRARAAWIADGYAASSFDSKFKEYINPADPQDYR